MGQQLLKHSDGGLHIAPVSVALNRCFPMLKDDVRAHDELHTKIAEKPGFQSDRDVPFRFPMSANNRNSFR